MQQTENAVLKTSCMSFALRFSSGQYVIDDALMCVFEFVMNQLKLSLNGLHMFPFISGVAF